MKLTQFKQDDSLANEGFLQVLEYENDDGETPKAWVRVARFGNPKFEAHMRKLMTPYKSMRKSKIPDEVVNKCTKEAMAKFILLEMVGFEDAAGDITGTKGAVIEDTFDNRFKVLMDKRYAEFVDMISGISLDFQNFIVAQEDEDLGKSESSSTGVGSGATREASSS